MIRTRRHRFPKQFYLDLPDQIQWRESQHVRKLQLPTNWLHRLLFYRQRSSLHTLSLDWQDEPQARCCTRLAPRHQTLLRHLSNLPRCQMSDTLLSRLFRWRLMRSTH